MRYHGGAIHLGRDMKSQNCTWSPGKRDGVCKSPCSIPVRLTSRDSTDPPSSGPGTLPYWATCTFALVNMQVRRARAQAVLDIPIWYLSWSRYGRSLETRATPKLGGGCPTSVRAPGRCERRPQRGGTVPAGRAQW